MAKKEEEPLRFETALTRLETIVEQMESGELELDRMIASFEEGQRLVAFCTQQLNEVERRIETIVKQGNGVAVEPFDAAASR